MRTRSALALCGLLAVAGCRAPGSAPSPSTPPLPQRPHASLPADWDRMPLLEFEAYCSREFPDGAITPFDRAARDALRAALDRMDPTSVRAAVLLGRSRFGTSAALLVRRLEARVLGPERSSDAADVVAAAALARFPDPRRQAQRLVALVVGPDPHPDLEVRVECAATALDAGFTEVVPFLLAVLRMGTYEGRTDDWNLPASDATAWARGRAAEALSRFAGVPMTYRTDGPIEARQSEASRLERLVEARLSAPPGPAPPDQGSTR